MSDRPFYTLIDPEKTLSQEDRKRIVEERFAYHMTVDTIPALLPTSTKERK